MKLKLKELLAEVLTSLISLNKKVNYTTRFVTGETFYLPSNGAKWVGVPAPTDVRPIALTGYYLNGYISKAPHVYYAGFAIGGTEASFAVQNNDGYGTDMSIQAIYLCVEK